VQVPFAFQNLRQIKVDLGKFSENPDKYTEAFQNLSQVFELTWKVIMLPLDQTLTTTKKKAALQEVKTFGNELYMTQDRQNTTQ
jgi:hypothetical protein